MILPKPVTESLQNGQPIAVMGCPGVDPEKPPGCDGNLNCKMHSFTSLQRMCSSGVLACSDNFAYYSMAVLSGQLKRTQAIGLSHLDWIGGATHLCLPVCGMKPLEIAQSCAAFLPPEVRCTCFAAKCDCPNPGNWSWSLLKAKTTFVLPTEAPQPIRPKPSKIRVAVL